MTFNVLVLYKGNDYYLISKQIALIFNLFFSHTTRHPGISSGPRTLLASNNIITNHASKIPAGCPG
jgi:hypothetical protein